MAMIRILMFTCGSFLLLMACRNGKAEAKASAPETEPFLLFQKTECLGRCPAYDAAIASDGTVQFYGWSNVPITQDTVYLTIPEQALRDLKQEAEKIRTLQIPEPDPLVVYSDMPSTITTFYKDGKEDRLVKQEEGGPQELLLFQEYVHQLLMHLVKERAQQQLPTK